jgi:D-alanyl-D-alanine carboxypeptidase.
MVKVPAYDRNVSLRPILQSGVDVRASPEAFGAGIGRGMQDAARGVSQLGESFAQVKELEDAAKAKEADNALAGWDREAKYGENGFLTLEGKSAVEGRAAYEQQFEAKRKEFGSKLSGGAARMYDRASQARQQSAYEQSIVHTANQRKTWFKEASDARASTFADDALVSYRDTKLVNKNIAAGVLELRQKGALEGWDADTLRQREVTYVSGVHRNIALRLAQDDPLAADSYIKANSERISGADQYALKGALDTEIKVEQSKREADAILSGGRAEVGGEPIAPAGVSQAGRTLKSSGPSRVRAFLTSKAPRGAYSVDNLDEAFGTNLAAMMQDAPPSIREGLGIMSGHRSFEHQTQLFNKSNKSGRMVARPGHSNHEVRSDGTAKAVDLSYNGRSLKHAPKEVLDWVHSNAKKYGMYFPMGWEPWHIEPIGTRGGADASSTIAPRSNNVAPRSAMPSFDDIEAKLSSIADPDVRDLTRKRLYTALEAQNKASEAQEKAAKAELWEYIDQGATPDQVPMEVRQAAGMAAVSSAWSYMETASKGRAVDSDETLLYDMRRYAALEPGQFADIDLNDYRDRLSKDAIKELTGLQTGALTDIRKAREDGLSLTTAFSQASDQLEAIGLTTTGKDGAAREAAAKRIAAFQNSLAAEMEAFKQANAGKNPSQLDIQSMVNKMLLPIVLKSEKSAWNPTKTPWSATAETKGFLFEAASRDDGTTVDVAVGYSDIPIDLRRGISMDLERELGRKPSEDEVVQRYEDYILNR